MANMMSMNKDGSKQSHYCVARLQCSTTFGGQVMKIWGGKAKEREDELDLK
jgi:hypothetical protein